MFFMGGLSGKASWKKCLAWWLCDCIPWASIAVGCDPLALVYALSTWSGMCFKDICNLADTMLIHEVIFYFIFISGVVPNNPSQDWKWWILDAQVTAGLHPVAVSQGTPAIPFIHISQWLNKEANLLSYCTDTSAGLYIQCKRRLV